MMFLKQGNFMEWDPGTELDEFQSSNLILSPSLSPPYVLQISLFCWT